MPSTHPTGSLRLFFSLSRMLFPQMSHDLGHVVFTKVFRPLLLRSFFTKTFSSLSGPHGLSHFKLQLLPIYPSHPTCSALLFSFPALFSPHGIYHSLTYYIFYLFILGGVCVFLNLSFLTKMCILLECKFHKGRNLLICLS